MKKLTLFATALAAVFAASSCSSDDSLAELNQAPKGKPFVINVANNDGTRGADITAVSKFNLSGTYGTTNWIPNYLFTKPGDAWVATGHTDLAWPTAAQVGENTHTFYATCDNTTTPPTITDGTFAYTVPAAIADQKDLLVAAVTGAVNETPIDLSFKHALSSVKFKIGYDADFHTGVMDNNYKAYVRKITLYHIPTNGTFDFSKFAATDNSQWTVSSTDPGYANIAITLAQEYFCTPILPEAPAGNNKAIFKAALTPLTTDYISQPIFVLPNLPTAWTPGNESPYTALTDSYIGVELLVYDEQETTDADYWDEEGYDLTDEDELADAVAYYTARYGSLDTSSEAWLSDKVVSIKVPTSKPTGLTRLPTYLSGITANRDILFQEVYFPLKMTNGFGFNKTNIITISLEQARMSTGAPVIQGIAFEIN